MENQAQNNPVRNEQEKQNPLNIVLDCYDTYVKPYLLIDVMVLVLFIIGGVIYMKTVTPLYSSTCRLNMGSDEIKVITKTQGVETGYKQWNTYFNTQLLLMQSSELIAKAKKTAGIDGGFSWPVVRPVFNTSLVDLTVTSPNPDIAAKMANTIAEVYLDSIQNKKVEITYTGINLLRDQLEEIRKAREAAMADLLEFKQQHQIFNLNDNYAALVSQINALAAMAADAMLEETELESALQSIQENRANAVKLMPFLVPKGANAEGNLNSIKMLYFTHQTTLPGLLMQYNEAHTAVKTHREVSKLLMDAQEEEVDTSIEGLKLRYKRSQNRRILVNKQIEDLRKSMTELDKISGDYRMRETACKSLDNTFTMLINRINEIKVSTANTTADTSSIYLVTSAVKGIAPVFPNTAKTMKVSILLGIVAAAALSYILATLNNKITKQEEVNHIMGNKLPVFGSVPLFKKTETELLKSSGEDSIDDVFRDIRTSLNLSMVTRNSKILAVCSAIPREGKTFIAFNLAKSFAIDKKRVLLMGLDLRKPRMDKMLESFLPKGHSKNGVSNILVGACKLDDAVMQLKDFGMDVVLSGPVPPNPTELLSSGGLKELLDEAQSKYDLVVLDTSPIIPVPDSLIVASHNIPLLIITRLFNVTRPILRTLSNKLAQVNINPAGLIINNVDTRKDGDSYYYNYGYGYGYGYGYRERKKHKQKSTGQQGA